MVGKIRGFLILCIVFTTLGIAAAVLAFVDLDRTWFSVKTLAMEAFPFLEEDDASLQAVSRGGNLEAAQLFTDAVFEALKSGKAKPGDLFELGQFYYRAKSDGHLDDSEMEQMIELADKTGIMDAVIDQALEPIDDGEPLSGDNYASNPGEELQALKTEFDRARADGHLNPEELMGILHKARSSGLQNQLAGMLPPDYDQTRARTAARNLAKAVVTGKASMDDVDTIMQMFLRAQEDGRLEPRELDRITQTVEMLAR